jgi:hypothetical protein
MNCNNCNLRARRTAPHSPHTTQSPWPAQRHTHKQRPAQPHTLSLTQCSLTHTSASASAVSQLDHSVSPTRPHTQSPAVPQPAAHNANAVSTAIACVPQLAQSAQRQSHTHTNAVSVTIACIPTARHTQSATRIYSDSYLHTGTSSIHACLGVIHATHKHASHTRRHACPQACITGMPASYWQHATQTQAQACSMYDPIMQLA